MRRQVLAAVAAIFPFFSGCDNATFDDGLRSAVRQRLKDPASALFEERIKFKNFACIKYNAKNGYGGYGGVTWAILEKTNDRWEVRDMSAEYCFESTLQQMAEPVGATERAQAAAVAQSQSALGKVVEVWACQDKKGHRYKASQAVPVDNCRLLKPEEQELNISSISLSN